MLARTATERTVADALAPPIRGFPQEAFTFPSGGLPELLAQPSAQFSLKADLELEPEGRREERVRYRLVVAIDPDSGELTVADERLVKLSKGYEPKERTRSCRREAPSLVAVTEAGSAS